MNSKSYNTLSSVILLVLSSAPSFQGSDDSKLCPLSSCNIFSVNHEYKVCYSESASWTGQMVQYIPPVDYKSRYKKIYASNGFKDAYYNKSLGENILIED